MQRRVSIVKDIVDFLTEKKKKKRTMKIIKFGNLMESIKEIIATKLFCISRVSRENRKFCQW